MGEHDDKTEWRLSSLEDDVKAIWGKLESLKTLLITNLVGVVFLLIAAIVAMARQ